MAIVVNPITRERPNELNQLALQIIAQKQAQNKINARDDINKAFENADAELKDAVQSGKLLQMLQYDDTTPAAQAMVQNYMTARAAREGRRMTPEDLERETQTFLQKFSENALLTPELTKAEERNYRPPAPSSAPTSSSASGSAASSSSPSPNQPSSGVGSGFGVDQQTLTVPPGEGVSKTSVDVGTLKQNFYEEVSKQYGYSVEQLKADPRLAAQVENQFKQYADEKRLGEGFVDWSTSGNTDALFQAYKGTPLEEALRAGDPNLIRDPTGQAFVRAFGRTVTPQPAASTQPAPAPAQAQPALSVPAIKSDTPEAKQYAQSLDEKSVDALIQKLVDAGVLTAKTRSLEGKRAIIAGNMGSLGTLTQGKPLPQGIKSTEEISKKSKEIVMNLSSTGDEMPVRVPKIAQETAKELQGKASTYEQIKAEGGLLARMKARKLEVQAAKVWKATKMSPEFKRISQDEYKYWDKWAKEATPEQLAISGMEEVAKIKNDAERIRVTKMLGQAELEYSYLKAAASAGNDAAAITLKQIDANVEIVKGMLSATNGDEKAFNKLLTNESFNSAVKAIGALNGVKPEDMFNFVKTWTGGVKAIPQDPAEWNNPFGALRQGLQAQPATSAATTYIQAQTQGR